MGQIFGDITKTIGRTPLVRLSKVTRGLNVAVLAKVESLNPGGSIKDRIGLAMIEEAERAGKITPGVTVLIERLRRIVPRAVRYSGPFHAAMLVFQTTIALIILHGLTILL